MPEHSCRAGRLALPASTFALSLAFSLACFPVGAAAPADVANKKYPDVVSVKVQPRGPTTFDFEVTVSSPYDSPSRYADAFRVMGEGGKVFGVRELGHDHAGEQPFTRDLHGVSIPPGVIDVQVQGRDQQYGWGGKKARVRLPGRQ
ncbi:MAG: hypothetical protein ABI589_00615 [Burkholderiales bacterium]